LRIGIVNVKDYRKQIEAQLHSRGEPAALATTAPDDGNREADWTEALENLANVDLDPVERRQAFQIVQAASFLGPQFAPLHARYLDVLRQLATDADGSLRRMALDALSNQKDDFARRRLTDGLRGVSEALVPPAVALGFLARDDHGSAHAIARTLLSDSADVPVREQAVRVLGGAPDAKSLLDAVMRDKKEFRQVRRASAVALRGLDPKMFEQGARDILNDSSDFQDIKSTVAAALQRSNSSVEVSPTAPTPATQPPAQPRSRRDP
jgi:HEAT repeat protein